MLEIFVDYFRRGQLPPSTFWQQISDSQLDLLVEDLRFSIDESQQSILSLRVLLSCPRIRTKSVLRAIELLQLGVPERAAVQIISEVNSSIVDSFDSASETGEEMQSFVEQVLLKILAPSQETRILSKEGLKGCAHAIEILPALLDSIPKYSADRSLSSIREAAMNSILSSPWQSSLVVPLLKTFLEFNLCRKEQQNARDKISSMLSSIQPEDIIGIIDTALALAEKYSELQWFESVRQLIDSTPDAMLGDAFCVIEISFQTSPNLVGLVTSFLKNQRHSESSKSIHNSEMSARNKMTSSDFVLFLLAAQNDLYKDLVIQSLVDHILQRFRSNSSRFTSPNNEAVSEYKELLAKVVIRAEAASMTGLLLELAMSILHSFGIHTSAIHLGEYLVTLLYICQPHSRSVALKMMFDALVENKHRLNLQLPFIRILQSISCQYLISLREHAQV